MPNRIAEIRDSRDLTQKQLAERIGVHETTMNRIEKGKHVPGLPRFEQIARELRVPVWELFTKKESLIPLMGYVGAGAEVEPDFEQVPPDGLDQIHLPFAIPDDMIAFQIRGVSMLPRYDDGDVLVVWRDQKRSTDSFIGEEAVVRTEDGRRFLKMIRRGQRGYNLDSWNAHPIENVGILWVGEIYATVRGNQLRRISRTPSRKNAA